MRGFLRNVAFGMGIVGTVLITMGAVGYPIDESQINWVSLLAAIAVGTGVTNTFTA